MFEKAAAKVVQIEGNTKQIPIYFWLFARLFVTLHRQCLRDDECTDRPYVERIPDD
jgi:hypothetical protein